jgi:predicted metal-dependent HD superfamily phosphohydrolase
VAPSPARGRAKRRDDGPHVMGFYDGARRLGTVLQRGPECEARSWRHDVLIGTYASRREACAAIGAANAKSRAKPSEDRHTATTLLQGGQ